VVRLVVEAYVWWQHHRAPVDGMAEFTAAWPEMPNLTGSVDHFADHPVTGEPVHAAQPYTNGKHAPELSTQAAATLGPQHTVVTPFKPRTHMPTLAELVKEVRRQSMGGTMPTQAQFNMAKPTTWATSQAHTKRLEITWGQLAEEAGLKLKRETP
jgi:hypothetical protein